MAILYGEGDYLQTVAIATSAGYDCDNQAATSGGLIGVMRGLSGMGEEAINQTKTLPAFRPWEKPFNDSYINISRDEIARKTSITEIVERIAAVAQTAIVENGGRVEIRDGQRYYVIQSGHLILDGGLLRHNPLSSTRIVALLVRSPEAKCLRFQARALERDCKRC